MQQEKNILFKKEGNINTHKQNDRLFLSKFDIYVHLLEFYLFEKGLENKSLIISFS